MFVNGRTAIEGLSGMVSTALEGSMLDARRGDAGRFLFPNDTYEPDALCGKVDEALPISGVANCMAHRGDLPAVRVDFETMRPPHTAAMRSSLLTTRCRLQRTNWRTSKTCGSTAIRLVPHRSSRRAVSSE